jgi:thioredoxin-related protein
MMDCSAPIIEFENAVVVGEVFEPFEAEVHPDDLSGVTYRYYGKAIYVYTIKATPGAKVKRYISATICNEDNACTANFADFTINLVETSTKPNIEWKVTSELIDVDNDLYQVTFDGAIKEGCRVYSKTTIFGDEYYYGAPVIEFEGVSVIDIQETLAPKEYEDNGCITYYYDDRIVYIYTIVADGYSADSAGYINGNIYSTSVDANGNALYDSANFKFKYITPQKQDGHAGRKYADFLHLPYQLQGHFDLDEAIEDAKTQNKPIFVDVTGHACNNCREMETMVWGSDLVLPKLKDEFVICALYVDDNTKVEGGKRLGSINSKLVQDKWQVNAQPAYIILSPDGKRVLAGPRGFDTNINGFVEFLDNGKAQM